MKKFITLLFTSLLSLSVCARDCGPKWLEKAVFYQIYPSSYMDTDGNGMNTTNRPKTGMERSRLDWSGNMQV
ncbi:MAG: hypothetical protein ACFN41_11680, partial [Hallella multisaccharivorax]